MSVVDTAAAEKLAIVPAGGGSMIDLGNRPLAYDVRLAVKGLSQIVERRPADLNVTVGAGVGLNRLNRVLEADGQRVAIDPPDDDLATVGGLIATNRTGGYAYGYGQPRDLILGLEMVDGCGRVLRVGGTVVKNVAGYDLVASRPARTVRSGSLQRSRFARIRYRKTRSLYDTFSNRFKNSTERAPRFLRRRCSRQLSIWPSTEAAQAIPGR